MRERDFDATHEKVSALVRPDQIEPGDLIMYAYGWCPVTHVRRVGDTVYVTFKDTSHYRSPPEWKPYSMSKRARVRRALSEAKSGG